MILIWVLVKHHCKSVKEKHQEAVLSAPFKQTLFIGRSVPKSTPADRWLLMHDWLIQVDLELITTSTSDNTLLGSVRLCMLFLLNFCLSTPGKHLMTDATHISTVGARVDFFYWLVYNLVVNGKRSFYRIMVPGCDLFTGKNKSVWCCFCCGL